MEDYSAFAALNQTKSNMNSTKSIAALFDFDGVVVDYGTVSIVYSGMNKDGNTILRYPSSAG